MMRQYGELKRRFPDYLLLFRLGDFYELFNDDAHVASRLLQLTLTSRQKHAIPMAGIPHHAADGYIARLIRAGQKVAVCEQLEEPAKGRKIVRRDVVRVITPGTITDTQFLDGARNNFLLAAHATASAVGRRAGRRLDRRLLGRRGGEPRARPCWRPRCCAAPPRSCWPRARMRRGWPAGYRPGIPVTRVDGGAFGARAAREVLEAHFRGRALHGLGVAALTAGLQAAGAAVAYVRETQGDSLAHLSRVQRLVTGEAMLLDPTAVATLELFETRPGAHRPRLALRHARYHRDPDGRPAAPPVDAAATARSRGDPPAAGGGGGPRRGSGGPGSLATAPGGGRGPRAPDQPGRAGGGPRARPGGPAGLPGSAAGARGGAGRARRPAPRHARRGDHPAPRPSETTRRGARGRAAAAAAGRRAHPRGAGTRSCASSSTPRARARNGSPRSSSGSARAPASPSLKVRFNRVFGYAIEVSNAHGAKVPRRVPAPPDPRRRRALRDHRAQGVREPGPRRRGAHRPARVRALRAGARPRSRPRPAPLLRTARAVGTLDALVSLADVAHERGHVRPEVDAGLGARDRGRAAPGAGGGRRRRFTPNDVAPRPGRRARS